MPETVKSGLKKWEILEEKTVYECAPWIRLDVHKIRLPDGKVVEDFHHLSMPEYVVVYPVTSDHKVVMLQAYRHGVGRVTHLLPGGFIDEGETPLQAAQRELLEETGYEADNWQSLGSYVPHSNYGGGQVHLFRATEAERVQLPASGDLEEAEIQLLDISSLTRALEGGKIDSLSSVTAIALGLNQIV